MHSSDMRRKRSLSVLFFFVVISSIVPSYLIAQPTIDSATTNDSDGDGYIDQLVIDFNEAVDVIDPGPRLDCFIVTDGYDIADLNYTGSGIDPLVVWLDEGASYDTGVTPRITYTQTGTSSIVGNISALEVIEGEFEDATDGAPPAFISLVTGDTDSDALLDELVITFSENVDISDTGGGADGLDCISVTGYSIQSGNYSSINVNSITLVLVEKSSPDTGVRPPASYNDFGSSTIVDRATISNEMIHLETVTTTDGADPIMLEASYDDPNMNGINEGDYIRVRFSEVVQLACTDVSDFELLNGVFGDTFGSGAPGSYLDNDVVGDVYINIVLGQNPSLILPGIWSGPGAENPSGLGIRVGGTLCIEDLYSNNSPQGAEVDIKISPTSAITTLIATDGTTMYENPNERSVFIDTNITVNIEFRYDASSVEVWYDVNEDPDGSPGSNPNDKKLDASGSGKNWSVLIPENDPEIVEGVQVRFMVETYADRYYSDGSEASGGSVPWRFAVVFERIDRVTIRENILNPHINEVTYIDLYLSSSQVVTINIYDIAGFLVRRLYGNTTPTGAYQVTWDGRNQRGTIVVPGVYYILIRIGTKRFVRKALVVR